MSFKDQVEKDVTGVFLDFNFFGTTHTVDGKECTVVVDDSERFARGDSNIVQSAVSVLEQSGYAGIYKKHVLFFIHASDMSGLPRIGRIMVFDSEEYIVIDATEETGIYAITLEENVN